MYGYGYYGWGMDPTILLLVIGMLLSLAASAKLRSTFLNIRSAIVPAANIGSQLSWPLFIAGLIFSIDPLVTLGIVLFSLAVLFQLVTLPVEINASSRALKMLESTGILGADEKKGARKVLTAAALTYVAALAASILQLLRLIILAGGRDRD